MEPEEFQTSEASIEGLPEAMPPAPIAPRNIPEWLTAAWKIILFFLVNIIFGPGLVYVLGQRLFGADATLRSPAFLLFIEAGEFAILFIYTLLVSKLEKTPFGAYGLPRKDAFSSIFLVGFLVGLAEGSVLIGSILLCGGYFFGTWALHGSQIAAWGLLHLILFLFVGLYEEFVFRGYAQYTLTKVIGFWPAAILLSAGFGLIHLGNQGEGWVGAFSVILVGLLFAFALKRTGNLWYAIGLHAGFDWAESFLYSVPDSGIVINGHLSNAVLHGPNWLTGGSIGPEGSVFCFITIGLQFLVVNWLFPAKKTEEAPDPSPAQT